MTGGDSFTRIAISSLSDVVFRSNIPSVYTNDRVPVKNLNFAKQKHFKLRDILVKIPRKVSKFTTIVMTCFRTCFLHQYSSDCVVNKKSWMMPPPSIHGAHKLHLWAQVALMDFGGSSGISTAIRRETFRRSTSAGIMGDQLRAPLYYPLHYDNMVRLGWKGPVIGLPLGREALASLMELITKMAVLVRGRRHLTFR